MKNLWHFGLDWIDRLPQRPRRFEYQDDWDMWWHGSGSTYHKVRGVWPWDRAKRIVEKNIGKSFDAAFSYYCSISPIYQQHDFLELFRVEYHRRGRGYHDSDYYIDEDGLIAEGYSWEKKRREEKPEKVIFTSYDAKWGWRFKNTSKIIPEDNYWTRNYYDKDKKYTRVLIQGFQMEFPSKKHPKYKEVWRNDYKARRMAWKAEREAKLQVAIEVLTNRERKKDEIERKIDYYKIISHGMDPLTSFTQN